MVMEAQCSVWSVVKCGVCALMKQCMVKRKLICVVYAMKLHDAVMQ